MPETRQPPDRGHIATEQRNPRTTGIDRASVAEAVALIQSEDARLVQTMQGARDALAALIEGAEPGFVRGGRLVYVGAGTSGRLGVLDASEAPPTFHVEPTRVVGIIAGGDRALRISSEGKEDDPDGARAELEALSLTGNDTVIGIAAGGTTPYVRGALAIAKACAPRCVTGFIACTEIEAPPGCDHLVTLDTGPEVITGSTRLKAGTATKLALNTVSTTLMIRAGRVYENLMVDLRATNDKLRDRAARIITTLTGLDRDGAIDLLDRAEGECKSAVLMQRAGLTLEEARARLAEAGGHLRVALDAHDHGPEGDG